MRTQLVGSALALAGAAVAVTVAVAPAFAVGGDCSAVTWKNSSGYRAYAHCNTIRSDSKAKGELVVWGPMPNKHTDWILTNNTGKYSGYSSTEGYTVLHIVARY